MGRNKLPEGMKRVRIFGRVKPATVDFFKSLDEPNDGRAMDKTVQLARGMQKALGYLEEAKLVTNLEHSLPGSSGVARPVYTG